MSLYVSLRPFSSTSVFVCMNIPLSWMSSCSHFTGCPPSSAFSGLYEEQYRMALISVFLCAPLYLDSLGAGEDM